MRTMPHRNRSLIRWIFVPTLLIAAIGRAHSQNVQCPGCQNASQERLAWFKEAKFGMFIHWGPYSHLGGQWNGRRLEVGRNGEWIMNFLKIPVEEYRKEAREFNPVRFDAQAWVALAKNAGMRYPYSQTTTLGELPQAGILTTAVDVASSHR